MAFVPLIVVKQSFFPYITGKNFLFRVAVEIAGSLWIALALLNKDYRPRRNVIFWALLAFIAVASLATIFGADPYRSFWSNFERMEGLVTYLHLFWLFLIVSSVFRAERDFAKLFFVSLGVSAIISVYAILEKFQVTPSLTGGGRVFATLGNSIYLAVYLLFHLFLLVWMYFKTKMNGTRWLLAGVFMLDVVGFLLAESRGALVGFAGGIFVALFLSMLASSSRRNKLILGGLLIAAALVPFMVVRFQGPLASKNIPVVSRLAAISLKEPTAVSRLMIWQIGWEGFKDRPILGWGPENFQIPYAQHYNPSLFGNEAWFDRMHSVVLDWFVHAGVLGGFSYLALFGAVFWAIWRLRCQHALGREESIIAASLVAAYLIQNLFVFDNITSHILFFSFLGFLAGKIPMLQAASGQEGKNSPRRSEASALILPAFFLLFGLVLAITVNLKPFLLSRSMIDTLNEAMQEKDFSASLAAFRRLLDRDTFGQREAREQLTNLGNTVAMTETRLSDQEKLALFDLVTSELEKETADHFSPKHQIFLGRMRQQFFSITRRNFEEAKNALERADELAPTYIQNRFSILELYLAKGDKNQVDKELENLKALMPASGSFWRTVMLGYIFNGEGNKAVRTIFDISRAQAAPDDLPILADRAAERKQSDAAFFLLKASKIYGGFGAEERLKLAQLAADRKRYNEAIKYAEEAAKLDPNYADQVRQFIESIQRVRGS